MKYLKTKTLSRFSASDNSYIQNPYGRITIDSTDSLRLPKGTTQQRPGYDASNPDVISTIPNMNGAIRYNTTTNAIEGYIGGAWETIRASGSTAIQVSRFSADGVETTFGPLNNTFLAAFSRSDYNLLVLVDNVLQIGGKVNYTVVKRQSGSFVTVNFSPFSASGPGSYSDGEYYIQFPEAIAPFSETGNPMYVTVFYGLGN
jgi:hypothetical protein